MLKRILFMCLISTTVFSQAGILKEIPQGTIDTLKSVDNLFERREFFLDKEIITKDFDKFNSYVMDNKGDVFVSDFKFVYKFNSKGVFIKKIMKMGMGPGEMKAMGQMAVDTENNLYIDDVGSGKIVKYNNDLRFIKEFKKTIIGPSQTMVISENKYVVCLLNLQGNETLTVYDKNSGNLVYKGGKNNKLNQYLPAFQVGGGMFIHNSKYYYVHTLDPQIHVIEAKKEYDLLKKMPSYFKTIYKRPKSNDPFDADYSKVVDFQNYGNTFFLFSLRPPVDRKFLPAVCDIISSNGEILKQRVQTKWLNLSKKLSEGIYYRVIDMRYSGGLEAGIKVRMLTIKERF